MVNKLILNDSDFLSKIKKLCEEAKEAWHVVCCEEHFSYQTLQSSSPSWALLLQAPCWPQVSPSAGGPTPLLSLQPTAESHLLQIKALTTRNTRIWTLTVSASSDDLGSPVTNPQTTDPINTVHDLFVGLNGVKWHLGRLQTPVDEQITVSLVKSQSLQCFYLFGWMLGSKRRFRLLKRRSWFVSNINPNL